MSSSQYTAPAEIDRDVLDEVFDKLGRASAMLDVFAAGEIDPTALRKHTLQTYSIVVSELVDTAKQMLFEGAKKSPSDTTGPIRALRAGGTP